MRFSPLLVLLLALLFSAAASAEYRAFLLRIAKRANPQDHRLVVSTLDPLQYPTYYTVEPDEVVTYDDTWMCRGRTGDARPVCTSPRAPASE